MSEIRKKRSPHTLEIKFRNKSLAKAYQELIVWMERYSNEVHVIEVAAGVEGDYSNVTLYYRRK